ncbi:MAG: FAD-binding protein [Lachnospiraceae bacterium]|nr:FAD-binding protein [Lachnospiraceae bacterium]
MRDITRRDFLKGALAGTASLAATSVLGVSTGQITASAAGTYTPGTYSSKVSGIGDIIVTLTFDEESITDVVLDLSNETASIGQAAEEELKAAILAAQSSEIDAVSGATVTSSAVAKGVANCIAQAKGEIDIEVISDEEATEDDDWLGTEPEIADSEITAEYDTEILVIGCGTGGMFAIAAAAEEGAKVIGIDRFTTGVGIRDDLGAINSRYQQEWGTEIDKFDYITMATQYAAGHINQDLVRLFCEESGDTINWYGDRLEERGVELWHESGDSEDEARYHHFATGHSPRWTGSDDGNGNELDGNMVLYDYAVGLGAQFDYETTMVKLVKEDDRVTGCIATNANGDYVKYNASKGVIVCTGGYSLNYSMMEALQPWNLNIIGMNGSEPGAWGDGIKACLWAGAKMDETHSMMMFDRCALRPDQETGEETTQSGDSGFFWMGSQPFLKVNADGKRFFNESGTYEGILHADEYQKGHCHYTLFDSNWTTYVQQFKMHGCSRLYPFENGADPNISYTVIENGMLPGLIESGFVMQADTIEELAEQLGLPPEELAATVEHYNEMAYAGEDTDFGKEAFRLTPVDTAPFYGAKNTGYVLCTMDGIQIDTNMNAIDTDGNPISGLYVVGNDSGSYFANTYPNLSTGMACGRTVTFARHVGKYLSTL